MNYKANSLLKFVENNIDWVEKLSTDPYNLKIKQHPTNKTLYLLSYDMIRSDFSSDIVKACRGIILDVQEKGIFDSGRDYKRLGVQFKNEVSIVVRAFDKFFNYHESNADPICWSAHVRAREKIDGSLIKYRFLKGKDWWMTNNSFTADGELPGELLSEYDTFQDLINEAIQGKNIEKLRELGKTHTVMFELTSPFNRIVVRYDGPPKLWLLGARDMNVQEEWSPEYITEVYQLDFDFPKHYELLDYSMGEVINIVNNLGSNHEGIVLVDSFMHRVKIKSEQYLAIHKLKDNNGQLSLEHILKCIQAETIDDILGMFPEYQEIINDVVLLYKNIIADLDVIVKDAFRRKELTKDENPSIAKKNFALEVKDSPFSKIYFECYKQLLEENCGDIKNEFLQKLDYESLKKYSNLL